MEIVGVGAFKLQEDGELAISALGSCVAVVLYSRDGEYKSCSLGHIFLPYSKNRIDKGAKYADTGIKNMLDALLCRGIKKENAVAKISGGANMFGTMPYTEAGAVGSTNARAVKETLMRLNIGLVSEDIGGSRGRKISFNISSKELHVYYVRSAEEIII
jgi:chemotaxis protein CheD